MTAQKPAAPTVAAEDPRPVAVLKAGETQTVRWCWGRANGRAEMWFVTADGVLPKGWEDGKPSQLACEQGGVRFEADVTASHRLSAELFENGPYTATQKRNANTFVTAAVVRIAAAKDAPPGGRSVAVHNISGAGYDFRFVGELRVLVTQ